jgi:hypothetical protein
MGHSTHVPVLTAVHAPARYVPAAQSVGSVQLLHRVDPSRFENVVGAHATHPTAPPVDLMVPGGHLPGSPPPPPLLLSVHCSAPSADVWSSPHSRQSLCPSCGWYVEAWHGSLAAEPPGQYEPLGHLAAVFCPKNPAATPRQPAAAHGMQLV